MITMPPEEDLERALLDVAQACEGVPCQRVAQFRVRRGCGCLFLLCALCVTNDRAWMKEYERQVPPGGWWSCICPRCLAGLTLYPPGLYRQLFPIVAQL